MGTARRAPALAGFSAQRSAPRRGAGPAGRTAGSGRRGPDERRHKTVPKWFLPRSSLRAQPLSDPHSVENRACPGVPAPQTNGMVERFNGRISDVLKSHHFRSSEELALMLLR